MQLTSLTLALFAAQTFAFKLGFTRLSSRQSDPCIDAVRQDCSDNSTESDCSNAICGVVCTSEVSEIETCCQGSPSFASILTCFSDLVVSSESNATSTGTSNSFSISSRVSTGAAISSTGAALSTGAPYASSSLTRYTTSSSAATSESSETYGNTKPTSGPTGTRPAWTSTASPSGGVSRVKADVESWLTGLLLGLFTLI